MRRIDTDLDADVQRFVDRAAAQIAVPPRSAPRVRRLAVLPLFGGAAVLVFVIAAALGVGRALNDARGAVATQPAATAPRSPSARPSREPTGLAELPDEAAVVAAFGARGLSVATIGASVDDAALGRRVPARSFVVAYGPPSGGFGLGAEVLFLRGQGLGQIMVCDAPWGSLGRMIYSVYVDGQRTSGSDAVGPVYYLVSPDYFAIAYDIQSRDALAQSLGLVSALKSTCQ